jgi:hypothetical protein
MRCSRPIVALWLMLCIVLPAWAHKASDSYLQLQASTSGMKLRVDVALRDLDVALDLDSNGDGRLTWGEVRAAWPAIEGYVRQRVRVDACELRAESRALERRADGVYAALGFSSTCVLSGEPGIRYALMTDVDPTHRGIARIELPGRPAVLRVLVPGPMTAEGPASSAGGRASVSDEPAAVLQFLREGVRHILTGYDHVLFLLCLLLPSVMRRTPQGWRPVERLGQGLWPILGVVTSFTLAHSITLGLAASKLVSLSSSFIEPAIAATIVLAAVDNLWPVFRGRRAVVTFFFGLIHGFGFASVLAELNLPTGQFAWALLQFNLGIEVGQLVIVAVAASLLFALRRRRGYAAWVIRGGSCFAIVVGTLWFVERVANVSLLPV